MSRDAYQDRKISDSAEKDKQCLILMTAMSTIIIIKEK